MAGSTRNRFMLIKIKITRMHSSRMRTGRPLAIFWGVCLVLGGVPGPGGVRGLGGCTWSRGVYLVLVGGVPGLGGVYLFLSWGVFAPSGCVPGPGGCTWSWGVSALGGCVSQHALRQKPPVNRMTDVCKNITLATTSLQPVKIRLQ